MKFCLGHIILIWLISLNLCRAQDLQWTSIDNLNDSIRKQPKPVLIFIYTDWCKYCKMQENNTFANDEVASKLNNDFYAIRLNGESREPIKFLNRIYQFRPNGSETGSHELAEYLAKKDDEIVYPTTVFLTPQLLIASKISGFINSSDLLNLLAQH
jgi:thioredoxin-related protein